MYFKREHTLLEAKRTGTAVGSGSRQRRRPGRAEPPLWSYQGSIARERGVPDKTRQGGRRGPQKDEAVEKSAYCEMKSFIHN